MEFEEVGRSGRSEDDEGDGRGENGGDWDQALHFPHTLNFLHSLHIPHFPYILTTLYIPYFLNSTNLLNSAYIIIRPSFVV